MTDKTAGECLSLMHQAREKIASAIKSVERCGVTTEIRNLILEITMAVRELEQQAKTVSENQINLEKFKS